MLSHLFADHSETSPSTVPQTSNALTLPLYIYHCSRSLLTDELVNSTTFTRKSDEYKVAVSPMTNFILPSQKSFIILIAYSYLIQ